MLVNDLFMSNKRKGKKHTDIRDELLHLRISSDTDQQLELAVGRVQPQNADKNRENNSTHRINPPAQLTATDGSENTESVNEQVIAVIFPEDANLRDLITESPAVKEESELCSESDGNGNDRGKMERLSFLLGADSQFADRESNQDERNGRHKETKTDIACCFDTGFASRELARIDTVDGLVAQKEGQVGHGVEDGVGHCGEQGEGAG